MVHILYLFLLKPCYEKLEGKRAYQYFRMEL